jgi:hypothetical protein
MLMVLAYSSVVGWRRPCTVDARSTAQSRPVSPRPVALGRQECLRTLSPSPPSLPRRTKHPRTLPGSRKQEASAYVHGQARPPPFGSGKRKLTPETCMHCAASPVGTIRHSDLSSDGSLGRWTGGCLLSFLCCFICCFLCSFLCHLPGALYYCWDRPGRRTKGSYDEPPAD